MENYFQNCLPTPHASVYTCTHSTIHYMNSQTSHLLCSLELYGIYLLFKQIQLLLFENRGYLEEQSHFRIKIHTLTHHCQHLLQIHSGSDKQIHQDFASITWWSSSLGSYISSDYLRACWSGVEFYTNHRLNYLMVTGPTIVTINMI